MRVYHDSGVPKMTRHYTGCQCPLCDPRYWDKHGPRPTKESDTASAQRFHAMNRAAQTRPAQSHVFGAEPRGKRKREPREKSPQTTLPGFGELAGSKST